MKDQAPERVFYKLQNVLTVQIQKSCLPADFQATDPYKKEQILFLALSQKEFLHLKHFLFLVLSQAVL